MAEFAVSRDGAVAVITIDNQSIGNALSRAGATSMADELDDIAGDVAVRAVLFRADGKQFCTGAHIGTTSSSDSKPVNGHMVRSLAASFHRLVKTIFECRVPVVTAVQGAALGAGLHLAVAADLVVAGELARFQEPFTDRGFSVDTGGSWLLPRLIGITRAKQFLYTGEELDAATALEWGLIAEVVAHDQLDGAARELAAALAARPTQALAATKRLLHDSYGTTLDAALHAESMAVELTLRSNDFKEGMRAFGEKRPPHFTGT